MSTDNELPDWLREMRDQQVGAEFGAGEPGAVPEEGSVEAQQVGEFDALREKASVEPPPEEPEERHLPIIGDLTPFQRFVLALMLFLNVSVLGFLFLMVAEKIALAR